VTAANLFFVVLIVAWVGVSGFYAGAARVNGELMWLQIMQGERKEEWPAPRWHYLWVYPLRWFFLWPVGQLVSSYRMDKERRRK
jgi:hypothetical protein